MKVLMIVTSPELGGTETHVLYLARELMRRGVEIGVATAGGPFLPLFTKAHIPVHRIESLERHSEKKSAARVEALVRRHGYDIVHVHDSESFHLLPPLRERLADSKLVMTVHGKYISHSTVRQAQAVADRILVVSPALLGWLRELGAPSAKLLWVPNGIDIEAFSPAQRVRPQRQALHLPLSGTLGLYVGRFQSDKVAIAQKCLEAAKRVAKHRPQFTMVLIGFGEYGRRLSREAKRANDDLHREAVLVREPTVDIAPFYRASTFVVGTGRVALEAMACGKPVIAAGYAGYDGIVTERSLPDLLVHNFGDHGAKAQLRTSRLVDDMTTLLDNPAYRRSLGESGRRAVVERFSIEQVATSTKTAYQSVLTPESLVATGQRTDVKGDESSE